MDDISANSYVSSSLSSTSSNPIQSPRKSHKRLFVLLTIFFTLFSISLAGFAYLEKQDREIKKNEFLTSQNISKTPSPSVEYNYSLFTNEFKPSPKVSSSPESKLTPDAISLTDLPLLFSEVTWEVSGSTCSRFKNYTMIYYESSADKIYGEIPCEQLKGQEWHGEVTVYAPDTSAKFTTRFSDYYRTEFSKLGWTYRVERPEFKLSTPAGGFMLGDTEGYIGVKNDSFRVFVIEDFREQVEQCPCKSYTWMFMSDILPLGFLTNYFTTKVELQKY